MFFSLSLFSLVFLILHLTLPLACVISCTVPQTDITTDLYCILFSDVMTLRCAGLREYTRLPLFVVLVLFLFMYYLHFKDNNTIIHCVSFKEKKLSQSLVATKPLRNKIKHKYKICRKNKLKYNCATSRATR